MDDPSSIPAWTPPYGRDRTRPEWTISAMAQPILVEATADMNGGEASWWALLRAPRGHAVSGRVTVGRIDNIEGIGVGYPTVEAAKAAADAWMRAAMDELQARVLAPRSPA